MKRLTEKALLCGVLICLSSPASASDVGGLGQGLEGLDLTIPAFDEPVAVAEVSPITAVDVITEAAEDVAPEASADLSEEELSDQRGGQTIQLTNQTMLAITSGNILNGDYIAGAVTLSDNALSNFNGIGNLLINTGAQVSLQTGMNFTINVGD